MRRFKLTILVLILFFSGISFARNAEAAPTIVNPNQVYSYSKMVSDIQKLKATYPDIIHVKVIGKSEYGRDLYAVSLGKGPATVLFDGARHAREWLTTNLNMYMINQYAESYENGLKIAGYDARSILNSTTIWFIPMVNPDGVTLQQQGLSAFPKSVQASLVKMNKGSKNFKRWKANGKGIDLNVQFNAGWKEIKGPTKAPKYMNFKGYAPESATETKAVLKFFDEINPEMTVSYHSSGKILYWNYKQDKARYNRDKVYANQLNKMTGYKLVNPGPNPSGGGFTDWVIAVKKRPGFTLEIAHAVYETNPPISEFSGVWKENQGVGLYIASEGAKLYNDRLYNSLLSQYKNVQTNAKKLQTYYSSQIKTESDLKITKSFTDLNNQVKASNQAVGSQAAKLPSIYRKKLDPIRNEINFHLTNAANYTNGINAGENLKAVQTSLNDSLLQGTLDAATVELQKELIDQTQSAAAAVWKMYNPNVRKLALTNYILPAKITNENTMYEISRYQLTEQINAELQAGSISVVKEQLGELEKLEQDTTILKQTGNKLHPGHYYLFPNSEKWLLDQKAAIEAQLTTLGI